MKKGKYKILPVVCMTSILFAGGCTANPGEKKQSIEQKGSDTQKAADTEIGKEKTIQDKKIKITEVKIIKDDTVSEKEQIVQVKFDIKNEGKEDFGIGSGDFYIKDKKGNTYEMYGRDDNFGDVIPADKSLQGNGYYKIAKEVKDLSVVYGPAIERAQGSDKESVEWKIGNPTK
ncbi:hypothetical protein COL26_33955 [Bacillus thuringiensis]|uniref:DUF4352 domain-containing protein n=1 Tax=Bacillus thuringiensis TaxID=1428 RepID=A0ABD6S6Q5_BACTU|nr:DUF4352 domain-containing protein [Bacillus thuringiensis]PER36573.1 hypothetical protein CN495_35320 [Bacillus thuringiensis]PEU69973.1 hypothetical protein CN411_33625 [Bacillus thuringiensis]PFI00319.1 hypothetical protein COI79_32035 [Bacillus thuringiensis]PFW18127.1 hypothetical protein COL26_33955 [Bacillus thuringiensis]PGY79231.1 hypothetical protein COE44_12215 [Bacillus thuringiensis]